MRELSLNILDIAENSLKAKATVVTIDVTVDEDFVTITIDDNGCGMSAEFLAKVTDPFTTTRTTRKVGMGIPLIKMAAEQCGGSFEITSQVDVGTTLKANFGRHNIDRPPLGSVGESIMTLLPDIGETRLIFSYQAFGQTFVLDSDEIKQQLDGIPLDEPEILLFIKQMIDENITTINGGNVI